MRKLLALILLGIVLLPATGESVSAQDREVPYWAALRSPEVNMRVGPSMDYPIDWVYRRQGLPVKVVRRYQGWRLIEDPEGAQGWINGRLLTLERGAIVVGEETGEIRAGPEDESELRWRVEPGVSGRLGDCEEGWCEIDVDGHAGWIREDMLWGPGEP